ncbi:MAG: hypothetical protein ABW022_25215 [Actinoplanes sp.]
MVEMSLRKAGPLVIPGLALVMFVFDFALFLVTYLLAGGLAPENPATFAGWVALVRLPIALAHMLAHSWRNWKALLTGGELHEPSAPTGWRLGLARVQDWGIDAVSTVIAVLIVGRCLGEPADAQLVAVSVVGPFLLSRGMSGVFWLWRRWRRT